jgi:hypothetical protein
MTLLVMQDHSREENGQFGFMQPVIYGSGFQRPSVQEDLQHIFRIFRQ